MVWEMEWHVQEAAGAQESVILRERRFIMLL